jgi:hypothetical protein
VLDEKRGKEKEEIEDGKPKEVLAARAAVSAWRACCRQRQPHHGEAGHHGDEAIGQAASRPARRQAQGVSTSV